MNGFRRRLQVRDRTLYGNGKWLTGPDGTERRHQCLLPSRARVGAMHYCEECGQLWEFWIQPQISYMLNAGFWLPASRLKTLWWRKMRRMAK